MDIIEKIEKKELTSQFWYIKMDKLDSSDNYGKLERISAIYFLDTD